MTRLKCSKEIRRHRDNLTVEVLPSGTQTEQGVNIYEGLINTSLFLLSYLLVNTYTVHTRERGGLLERETEEA